MNQTRVTQLKEMFSEMVMKKNSALIPEYYHPEMLLYTNEKIIDYKEFLDSHLEYYAGPIEYNVTYDEDAWVIQQDRLAGRIFITINTPNEMKKKIEVILIVQYKDDKIFRIWELTYPDWSKESIFQSDIKSTC